MLVEELASHGYVVVAIDHTYEASEVEFPDGRVAVDRRPADAIRGQCAAIRVADIRFVLDTLTALAAGRSPDAGGQRLPPRMRGSLDLTRDVSWAGFWAHQRGWRRELRRSGRPTSASPICRWRSRTSPLSWA